MALVERLARIRMDRHSVHEPVSEATFSVFKDDRGQSFLQIDTYGSSGRKLKGKKSQSLQFGLDSRRQLREILSEIDSDR
jgi:hypothetical protein